MSIALPLLFALAGLLAMASIWRALSANLSAIVDLRRAVARPGLGAEIVVNLREPFSAFEPVSSVRKPRQVRHPVPKPVTHRLHQFARERSAVCG